MMTRATGKKFEWDAVRNATLFFGCWPSSAKYFDSIWHDKTWPRWQ